MDQNQNILTRVDDVYNVGQSGLKVKGNTIYLVHNRGHIIG